MHLYISSLESFISNCAFIKEALVNCIFTKVIVRDHLESLESVEKLSKLFVITVC